MPVLFSASTSDRIAEMKRLRFIIMAALLSCMYEGQAQILPAQQDPAGIKWYQIRTPGYKFIYPEGYDSLAVRYARLYEGYRQRVAVTSGFLPARVPVVLHPENAAAEYSLSQLPSRIDMSILPQGYLKFSYPVQEMAAISLSRQASHLEFGYSGVFRPFTWLFGELFPIAVNLLYPDSWLRNGDAAVAATALVPDGYGRYGEFINYYMAALDAGDVRGYKWDRWAIGSYKNYTPDSDAFGYMILSGLRTKYGKADYTADYLTHISKRPYDLFYGMRLNRKTTGKNLHSGAFRDIFDYHRSIFADELEQRAPFTVSEPVIPSDNKKYADYSSAAVLPDGTIFAVRKSLDKSPCLVRISSGGNEKRITSFAGSASRLVWSDSIQRLYWSETDSDWRWKQKKSNIIRYYDPEKGKTGTLTDDSNVFNPCLSPDGTRIAAIYGPEPDRTSVIILDAVTGHSISILPFPSDRILLNECAWTDDGIYACGVSESGTGIFRTVPDRETGYMRWEKVAGPIRCTVRNLGTCGNDLIFSCDASGVFELYRAVLSDGKWRIFKITSEKYGAKDFVFDKSGAKLYFSRLDHLGYDLHAAGSSALGKTEISLDTIGKSVIARELAEQEKQASANLASEEFICPEPVRYRKGLHLFRLHSWAPLYCNPDKLSDMSGEKLYDYASVGATVLSQNNLGTAYGSAGYCWRPAPDGSGWAHGGHVSFGYAGWYPVIECSLLINDRQTWNYFLAGNGSIARVPNEGVSLAGKMDIYVPLSREIGGKSLSFKPKVSWEIDNNRFNGLLNHSTTISGEFSLLRDMAKSEIFPRYGIGVETGIRMAYAAGNASDSVLKLGDSWYFHSYGYFPGITSGQGGKVAVTTQMHLSRGIYNPASEILPRGLSGSILRNFHNPYFAALLTFDYTIPVHLGDINITPLIYLNRMIITPHFDYAFSVHPQMHLCSGGSSLTFQLGRLFWSFPLEIGADYSYNFGTLFSVMDESGAKVVRHSVRPVIRIKF